MRTIEHQRLLDARDRKENWLRWGPYLSERQWGTVREDYSEHGECWTYFPHDHARSRAYRWGEDGLLGLCDRECRLCLGVALWNGQDAILKERLFGMAGPEGNHGEDVKELYYYLDSSPTHSYLKALYKYPHAAYPYAQLLAESRRRNKQQREFELLDTGLFHEHRYWDVQVEYAKNSADDLVIRFAITNRGPEPASIDVLPSIWFRNTWSWGCTHEGCERKPVMLRQSAGGMLADHPTLGRFRWQMAPSSTGVAPRWLLTENETNHERLFAGPKHDSPCKDAFHDRVIHSQELIVDAKPHGTKAAAWYHLTAGPGETIVLIGRLCPEMDWPADPVGPSARALVQERIRDTDQFYASLPGCPNQLHARQIARQAYAGLLWTKQFYHYAVEPWLHGDPEQPPPPAARLKGRNSDWSHLFNRDVISMPDKWEYPWYAAWDLAFHMLPMATIDADFAKQQLILMLREWYMHPNGQIPAYEFALGDVNPPVHAWACWRVYKMTGKQGERDRLFLARTFQKLLINFTWWINRKDVAGKHLFAGGFLGLDNIGVFDRSKPLPTGGYLEQADGTAWMAFYCTTMLAMALELAEHDPAYEDVASKFFEHFVAIADAMNCVGGTGLWDETDGFYYDQLHDPNGHQRLKIRSIVGIIPLFAVEVLDDERLIRLKGFQKRMEWFLANRQDLAKQVSYLEHEKPCGRVHLRRLLALPSRERLTRVLRFVLDEQEFLAPHGIRALSRVHHDQPFVFHAGGQEHRVAYDPAESSTYMFGGNSNWRGPIWFPVNYLLIESLERYHFFYGDDFKVECPVGSGQMRTLKQVAEELSRRLCSLFLPDANGQRPCHGDDAIYQHPEWRELILFYEYFHGDNGRGVGASHQTGWTALVANLLAKCGDHVTP